MQRPRGGGQIILDDGSGTGTALNGNGGSITITAGTGGIAALAANNNTAEITTTGASVTLLTDGPIGTSTNRIQFADDSNTAQQVVSIGSTSVQPSSVYLDGLGSLTLGNVAAATAEYNDRRHGPHEPGRGRGRHDQRGERADHCWAPT